MTDKNIPRFVIPERAVSKFVQLYIDGEAYLRHDSYYTDHSLILEETLKEFGLRNYVVFVEDGRVDIKGERYEAVGMGFLVKSFENDMKYNLSDISYHHGIGPNQKHLDDLTPYLPEGIKLTIREKR